ncbi:Hypothetical protein NocV09_00200380 [Nannochloropsis oceanica]
MTTTTNISSSSSSSSSSSISKRYLILTHTAGVSRVHYPLPLRRLQISCDTGDPSPTAAISSPTSPCPFVLFDATAAGQTARPEEAKQALLIDNSCLKQAEPPSFPFAVPSVLPPRSHLPPPLLTLDRQRSGSAPAKEGGSDRIATQSSLRRAKEAAYRKKIQRLEIALVREKREAQSLHLQHMKEMANILKHQEVKCACRISRAQVFPINTDALSESRTPPKQASVLEEGRFPTGPSQVVVPPTASPHSTPAAGERAGMRVISLLPYLFLFLLLALAIVLIIVLAQGLMM